MSKSNHSSPLYDNIAIGTLVIDRVINTLGQISLAKAIIILPLLLHDPIIRRLYHGRAYSYCSGGGFSAAGQLSYKDLLSFGFNYRIGLVKTLSGNSSHHILHGMTSEISYSYIDRLSVSILMGSLTLIGRYQHFEKVDNHYPYLRISTRYSLKNR